MKRSTALWLAMALLLPVVCQGQTVQVWFGPKAAADEDGIYKNFVRFLDSAETSIYGSIHEMDMISVARKLAAKAEEGIDVQLVLEASWWDEHKNTAAREVLEKSRIHIDLDTKKSGLQHNKFWIVDRQRVWTGSVNMTETGFLFNPNSGVWIENEQVALNYLTEFVEQREGKFGKRASGKPNTPHPDVSFAGGSISTYFGPEDDPIEACVNLINSAQQSIEIMCFVFSSEEVCEAVLKAHRRGVKVRVLLDDLFSSAAVLDRWRYVPSRELTAAGIQVKYDNHKAKLHHKTVIVDDARVQVGSMNLSANGAKSNDENIVIIRSAEIAKKYAAEFDRLWNLFPGEPGEGDASAATDSY